jgi:hypothetical protein
MPLAPGPNTCWVVRNPASRKSMTAFGSSASCILILDTSTWKTLQPATTPSAKVVTHVLGTRCYLCVRAGHIKILERAKGFEPSTPTLARSCSTTELHPHPRDWRRWCAVNGQTYAKCRSRMQQPAYRAGNRLDRRFIGGIACESPRKWLDRVPAIANSVSKRQLMFEPW